MERKKLLTLFISSAMLGLWACAEGDIVEANDKDEMVQKLVSEKDDYEFVEPFMKYCQKKKGCEAEYVKSSSSVEESSSSEEGVTSGSSKSSSSVKGSSASGKSSSSGNSSSSKGNGSSASSSNSGNNSSQSTVSIVSGKCVLEKPEEVHVGDEVVWRYAPDKGSIESADFVWEMSNEVEKSLVEGTASGTGTPAIKVVFKTAGRKYGPFLHFGNEDFDCDNLVVAAADENHGSSAYVESSSSAESSSSKAKSSSSKVVVKGHCAVSKEVVATGEKVDWYVAGPDGEMLEGNYTWVLIDNDAKLDEGSSLTGKDKPAKITVTYSTSGVKGPMVRYEKQTIMCDTNEEGDPMLHVELKAESSSSKKTEASSSSTVKSSSSKAQSSSSGGSEPPPVID